MPADSSTRSTVLIVDDTPENLTILGETLRPHYRVRAAISGERALHAVTIGALPDVILLDVMMPDMDGYQVLQALQADAATRDIPVIFVTAMDSVEGETHGLALGAVDYITKPFNPDIVLHGYAPTSSLPRRASACTTRTHGSNAKSPAARTRTR